MKHYEHYRVFVLELMNHAGDAELLIIAHQSTKSGQMLCL